MSLRFRPLALIAAVAAALTVPATASATEILFGTTADDHLVSFTAEAPRVLRSKEPIGGLAADETVVGIARRPATAQLYLLTSAGRILVVDRSSGDTRVITPTPLPLTGTSFGFDFNPKADRIRIVSDADQNLRVHPDTGLLVATDGPIAYGAGDANAGQNPSVGAVAYTNSGFGPEPSDTALFGIDTSRDTLVSQDANAGTLTTVGALGVDAVEPAHLTITGNGNVRYAAFATNGDATMRLWRIDDRGAAAAAAIDNRVAVALTALTSVGETADDEVAPVVAVGNYTTWRGVWTTRGLRMALTCTTECDVQVTLRIGNTLAGRVSESLPGAGTRSPRITLTDAGRARAARSGRLDASLRFRTTDAAGNTRVQVARFESLPGLNPVQ